MDRLFSLFTLYDFVSYVLVGLLLIAGVYWAVAGVPQEPGTAVVLGLVAAGYIAGHLVQALGVLWEPYYWRWRGGWPSQARMDAESEGAFDSGLRAAILDRLAAGHGEQVRAFNTPDQFALARADLRSRGADARAELMNALYALSRGLATVSLALMVTFGCAWIATGDTGTWLPATATALLGTALFLTRFGRFGFYFADQVWRDYLATSDVRPKADGSTHPTGQDRPTSAR